MKTYSPAELAVILDAHRRWLNGDRDGSRADLAGADLAGANLAGADLAGANLADANLTGAYLAGANLADANLTRAYLTDANLTRAYLAGAYLAGAYLAGANLAGANLPPYSIVPDGAFTAYKKLSDGIVATLLIPEDAERVGGLAGRKCRASKVLVTALSGDVTEGCGLRDKTVIYRVGETVTPDRYDPDIRVECAAGIHFFIARAEAEAYDV